MKRNRTLNDATSELFEWTVSRKPKISLKLIPVKTLRKEEIKPERGFWPGN